MGATISVICYKSKTLANGEHPLMLKIAQNEESDHLKSIHLETVTCQHQYQVTLFLVIVFMTFVMMFMRCATYSRISKSPV